MTGNAFLFSELIKRDFKKKYKNTYLGMLWSMLSPLLTLLIMSVVFKNLFGRDMEHYTIYLFCGNIVFSYFSESTSSAMGTMVANAPIYTRITLPKHLFLLSRGVCSLINLGATFAVFLLFTVLDGITPTPLFLMLLYPTVMLVIFSTGLGLILSTLFVLFRDMQYLWSIFTTLLSYLCAIFYTVSEESFGAAADLFLLNPLYVYISYFRSIVLDGTIPSLSLHALSALYASVSLIVGTTVYQKCNQLFVYYV